MFTRALKLYSIQSWPWIQFSDCLFWLDCLRCIHADDLGNLDDNYDDCLCVDAHIEFKMRFCSTKFVLPSKAWLTKQ